MTLALKAIEAIRITRLPKLIIYSTFGDVLNLALCIYSIKSNVDMHVLLQ